MPRGFPKSKSLTPAPDPTPAPGSLDARAMEVINGMAGFHLHAAEVLGMIMKFREDFPIDYWSFVISGLTNYSEDRRLYLTMLLCAAAPRDQVMRLLSEVSHE